MQNAYLLSTSEKIFDGIRDYDTVQSQFAPLWEYPVVLENFMLLLRHKDEDHRKSFETVCLLLCPDFLDMVKPWLDHK